MGWLRKTERRPSEASSLTGVENRFFLILKVSRIGFSLSPNEYDIMHQEKINKKHHKHNQEN